MKTCVLTTFCIAMLLLLGTGCRKKSGSYQSKKVNSPKALAVEASGFGFEVNPVARTLADDLGWRAHFENGCSEATLKTELPTRKLLYFLGHGNAPFTGVIFGNPLNPTGIFKPPEVPAGINYIMVFFNGCKTLDRSQGTPGQFAAKFRRAQTRFTYIGNEMAIGGGKAAKFGEDFFEELDGFKRVGAALADAKRIHAGTACDFYDILIGTNTTQVIDR